jgi:hypothetical protein
MRSHAKHSTRRTSKTSQRTAMSGRLLVSALGASFALWAIEAVAQAAPVAVVEVAPAPVVVVTPEEERADRPGGMVGGILGFGTHAGQGFGLGAEGGYTFPFHLYAGANFTYFVGSDNVSGFYFAPEVGYDLAVIPRVPILIRPYVGLGYESLSAKFCVGGNCVSGSTGTFVFSPGVMGDYFFTPHVYAGLDLRLDILTASGGFATFDVFAGGGYKF